jgi:hypothetical protein
MKCSASAFLLAAALLPGAPAPGAAPEFRVTLPAGFVGGAQDGRLLVILAPADQATDAGQATDKQPRALVNWGDEAMPFFGIDVEGWKPGTARGVDAGLGCGRGLW